MRGALLLLALAAPATAEPFFACDFGGGRDLSVTHDAETARYAFRHPTNSLTLTRPFSEVHYTPWPGVGGTIWEEVGFDNAGFRYSVFASIDRAPEAEPRRRGGVIVFQGDREITRLECLPGSIQFDWGTGLFDAMEGAGQCYDPAAQSWAGC